MSKYKLQKNLTTNHQIRTMKLCLNQQGILCYRWNYYLFHGHMNMTLKHRMKLQTKHTQVHESMQVIMLHYITEIHKHMSVVQLQLLYSSCSAAIWRMILSHLMLTRPCFHCNIFMNSGEY